MTVILFILAACFLSIVVSAAAIVPHQSRYSTFELERRRDAKDVQVTFEARRQKAFGDIVSIQRIIQAAALVGFVASGIALLGWLMGILVAIAVSLTYGKIAALRPVHRWAQKLYNVHETTVLTLVERYGGYLSWLRVLTPATRSPHAASREELRKLVTESSAILSRDETTFVLNSMDFGNKSVRDVLTPKSVVDTIQRTEVLGPLVLDDLHKTGHSRFPVIDTDIDHIVGMLYLRDVLTLDTTKKHAATVESAMSTRVHYIREDHTLSQALSAFLKTHHHMFIVINRSRETVGILTLEDTIEALLGKRIVDEFDTHDDMRAVAQRDTASAGTSSPSAAV